MSTIMPRSTNGYLLLLPLVLVLIMYYIYTLKSVSQNDADLVGNQNSAPQNSPGVVRQRNSAKNGPVMAGQYLPARWEQTTHGYTVDCCNGSPNTKHWPQRHVAGRELTQVENNGKVMYEDDKYRKFIFEKIFKKRIWGQWRKSTDEFSASGDGSTVEAAVDIMRTLNCVIEDIKMALNKSRIRMLDVPCGDLLWMNVFLDNRSDIDYTGVDIVPDLIEHHNEAYAQRDWKFHVHDIVAKPLSESYDLIHTRDMTMHLSTGDTMKVLEHISSSGSAYGVFSTFPIGEPYAEIDVDTSRYREQNLEGPPYSLVPPMCVKRDKNKLEHQFAALWRLPLQQHA